MKRPVLLILTALFLVILGGVVFCAMRVKVSAGRVPAVEWSHTYGKGEARFVTQAKDGGYVFTGWLQSRPYDSSVFLARVDPRGNRQWMKVFNGNGYSCGYCVKEVNDGGFIVVGETKSRYGFDHDVYVVRTDAGGNLIWQKTFGGRGCDYAWSVQHLKDGGFIVAGGTESFGAGLYDVYLIKLDSSGNEIWEKTYGGKKSDCAYAVQQTADGGFLVVGNTDSFGSGNPGIYLLKTDGAGRMSWQKTYGGKGSNYGWSLLPAGDGDYLIAGEKEVVTAQGGTLTACLLEVDASGHLLWEKTYGDGKSSSAFGLCRAVDGGFVWTGKRESERGGYDIYAVKTDSSGRVVWEKSIKGAGVNCAYSILPAKDGGYLLAGRKGMEKASESDILLLKLK